MSLVSLEMLGTLCLCSIKCSPGGLLPGHAEQSLSIERSPSFLATQHICNFLTRKQLCSSRTFMGEELVALLDKAKARQDQQYQEGIA